LRAWSLRLIYIALLASSILYAGAGDVRAMLLTLATSLAFASMVELYLHVYEVLFSLLLLGATAVGAIAFYTYPDFNTRLYVVLCIAMPLIVYVAHRETLGREEKSTRGVEDAASDGEEVSDTL
jgi:membrane protein implicated in regulation of membrane protease activity